MAELTLSQAQADMRHGYLGGAPGVLVSGLVWLTAAALAALHSEPAAVLALLVGGALIFPLSLLLTRGLGRPARHQTGNGLGRLAMESTWAMLAGIAIACGIYLLRPAWFFPAMLLLIGGRYLGFQTLYGLRVYWLLGALLCAAGLALALVQAPLLAGALAGAAIELALAGLVWAQTRRRAPDPLAA